MTFWELIRVLLRYWPVVLIGGVCTVAVGLIAISDDGVYFTRTNIAFQAPASALQPNAFRTQSEDVIATAGAVAKRVAGPGKVTKFSSPDVTLVGLGVRDGWSLRLPDTGGQWASNFTTQMLTLDVVGPTPEIVATRQAEVIQRVQDDLYKLQRDAGVRPVNNITAVPAPDSTVVYHVRGNRMRALGMVGLMGIGLTIMVAVSLDRRRQRRNAVDAPSLAPDDALIAS